MLSICGSVFDVCWLMLVDCLWLNVGGGVKFVARCVMFVGCYALCVVCCTFRVFFCLMCVVC